MIIRYPNQVLFCTTGDSISRQESGDFYQLNRIQDYSLDISVPYYQGITTDNKVIYQTINRPTATLGINYLNSDLNNELAIGFLTGTTQSAFADLNTEKNYYIRFSKEGVDAIGDSTQNNNVIGLGNGLLNSYSVSAAVGNELKTSLNYEFLEVKSYTGTSNQQSVGFNHETQNFDTGKFTLPTANSGINYISGQAITAISHKDIILNFSTGNCFGIQITGANSCYLQNFNLAVNFNRSRILELGKKYPVIRPIIYPIEIDLSAEAILNGLGEDFTSNYFCSTGNYNVELIVQKQTSCYSKQRLYTVQINGLKLERQTFNASLGGPNSINLGFKGLIANNFDSGNNIWIV